ncbi:NACHT domain-containing protein [Neisseria weaveri]|uniref:NACHT domain-containing protein n=1 Tax=Neisseria weaveri TaxID=28091 RepID=UPI0002230436|nr:hypothetical protein [Neisseria weaveri]EGV35223.1 hypothetical protein l13_16410 [Neisseria weaveri ATCC 51223]
MSHENFYLPRRLQTPVGKIYQQSELLGLNHKLIIILAEPGAGKTSLLDSLAKQLSTQKFTANTFIYQTVSSNTDLVIDAFDELARIDDSGIFKIIGQVKSAQPNRLILSSRSGEWYESYTQFCKEIFGEEPLVVYLNAFNEKEQKALFEHYCPTENFSVFQREAERIELTPLLINPLFLRIFSGAYLESGKKFTNRRTAFQKAIENLVKENNPCISARKTLPSEQKIALAEDIFAKLLLSGSEGVSVSDRATNRFYPHINALHDDPRIKEILATQLFHPAEQTEQHKPAHRIIAEYCAAQYLAKRLQSATDPLSLRQCLSIIAPNGTTRDELRGLIAWLAALTENQDIQETLIDLDPYAVLANGDPSLLLPSSKMKLLHRLKNLNKQNPLFRRNDRWRSFSVFGFFTSDTVPEIKELLREENSTGHLQGLLLELLEDSLILPQLANELEYILRDVGNGRSERYIRNTANRCLLKVTDYDHKSNFNFLLDEAGETSLQIAAELVMTLPTGIFEKTDLLRLLRACEKLYSVSYLQPRIFGTRFFIRELIQKLDLETVEYLLNKLSANLSCTCNVEYNCQCRIGISKIIGRLLDRYFELATQPYCPEQVWQWIGKLYFQGCIKKEESLSVQILQGDDNLRQDIFKLLFEHETEDQKIHQICKKLWRGHAGLFFQQQDYWYIVNLAFEIGNTGLWQYFIPRYHPYNKEKLPNSLRKHMREQALQKPEFLRIWAKHNRDVKSCFKKSVCDFKIGRKKKKHNQKQTIIREKNIQYIQENRELIENGKDWVCLKRFSYLTLMSPQKIIEEVGNENLVKDALYNCLEFIAPHIPDFAELTQLQCKSKFLDVEQVLYAACLEIFRRDKNLNSVPYDCLAALRTHLDVIYFTISEKERDEFKQEIERLIFKTPEQVENFLRNYIEPQLADSSCQRPQVSWLRDEKCFQPFREILSLEWLTRFPNISGYAQKELLEQAIEFDTNREQLKELITNRCQTLLENYPEKTNDEQLENSRNFWFAHAFYLLETGYEPYWQWLAQDKDTIFILDEHIGSFGEYREWLTLSAEKIEAVLNAFIDKWPKVDLPNMYGSDSPKPEKAYRFLSDLIWKIDKDKSCNPVPVIDRLLNNDKYEAFHTGLKSIRFTYLQKTALQNFQAPEALQIKAMLEQDEIISIEHFRTVLLEELQCYQVDLNGHDITSKDIFYDGGRRVDENRATQIIADRLRLRLESRRVTVTLEHQMHDTKRCDFTCSKIVDNQRLLLATEVKGQWHHALYSAAEEQLYERYANHPDTHHQGIYLVLWFGAQEEVAGRTKHEFSNATDLKISIEQKIPENLKKQIDVFVLDVSR